MPDSFSRSSRPEASPRVPPRQESAGEVHVSSPIPVHNATRRCPHPVSTIEFWQEQLADGDAARAQKYYEFLTEGSLTCKERLLPLSCSPALSSA
eukprot:748087-Hanusia_phi.AAC.3